MRIAIEIIFLAIIAVCVWNGYKKGLVMGIGAILVIVISLFVGDLLSDTFSHEASPVLRPFVGGYMEGSEGVIGKSLDEIMGTSSSQLSVDDAIALRPEINYELCEKSFMKMGVYSVTAKKMAIEAVSYADKNDASLSTSIVNVICDKLTYYIGFTLFFIITLIVLSILGNLFNLSFKIPEMDKLNDIGGAVAGLVTGFLFCAIAAWLLKFSGMLLPEETISKTLITALFLKMNLMSSFLSI